MALVVTVIVILILAGTSISLITGEDGLFAKANSAASLYNQRAKEEAERLNMILSNYNTPTVNQKDITETVSELMEANLIDEVLKDAQKVDVVIADKITYGEQILNETDTTNFEKFVNNNYALNKMIDSDEWRNEILASNTFIEVLDNNDPVSVPMITSYSSIYGEAFASSEYDAGGAVDYSAWCAFDDNISTYWSVGNNQPYKNQYLGYSFTNPVWVYKTEIASNDGKQKIKYNIEATNNKNDANSWVTIKSNLSQGSQVIISDTANANKYRYYRIRITEPDVIPTGSGNTIITQIKFYAK